MANIGIFYGSTTGMCEDVARRMAEKLGGANVWNASELDAATVAACDVLLLGSSTWGAGELQDDWYGACNTLHNLNLTGKKVALFSVGDSVGYGDTFCGALRALYDAVKDTGATLMGQVSTDGYTYDDSEAVIDGQFVGLALDETNEADKTDARIDAWLASMEL
ncbi:MAG: flavodoxin FldA [Muribaculaceae bacterium]|nr:flavodoxin FldA [Muribaculaceae bacterium]